MIEGTQHWLPPVLEYVCTYINTRLCTNPHKCIPLFPPHTQSKKHTMHFTHNLSQSHRTNEHQYPTIKYLEVFKVGFTNLQVLSHEINWNTKGVWKTFIFLSIMQRNRVHRWTIKPVCWLVCMILAEQAYHGCFSLESLRVRSCAVHRAGHLNVST